MKTRHDVASPTAIHLRDWWAIVVRVFWRVLQDNLGLLAAGISFYAFLSILPAIAAALMVWGIFTDTISLGAQLETVRELAPDAFNLVADQMVVIAMQDDGGLTVGVLVSALFAFWGASGAVAALLMWFWISAFSVCLGAALNAQLELFTTANTTIVEPTRSGEHGAYVADHVESPEAPVEDPVSLSKA